MAVFVSGYSLPLLERSRSHAVIDWREPALFPTAVINMTRFISAKCNRGGGAHATETLK